MSNKTNSIKPNPKDIEQKLTPKNDDQEKFYILQQQSEKMQTHLKGLKDFYKHRNIWSWFLLATIGALIIFQISITFGIGFHWLDFVNYKTIIGLIVSENFAQIVGMGIVVVKFLFNENTLDKFQ